MAKIKESYKISNARCGKIFENMEDVELHIKDNNLKPLDLSDTIKVTKTTIEVNEIEVSRQEVLSRDSKLKLMKSMLNRHTEVDLVIYQRVYDELIKNEVTSVLCKYLKQFNVPITSKSNSYRTQPEKIKLAVKKFLNYLINNIGELDLLFVKVITNWKPSNGYGIKFNGMYLLYRENDLLISEGSCIGRNVNYRYQTFLFDSDVKKLKLSSN